MISRKKKIVEDFIADRIDRTGDDIVSCALRNDFRGVDRELARNPDAIRNQWIESGITALMAASGRGLERMVQHLLAKDGIDFDQQDNSGKTAFDHARPHPKIVRLIMSAKHPGRKWSEPGVFPV